jgi:soluble cytochrome b562
MDINWSRPNSSEGLESKLNMYERQIDQLFDFVYKEQDDIKILFKKNDDLIKWLDTIEIQFKNGNINELKMCIQNYYQLELENKRRMEYHEHYNLQLFIVQIFIICYLIYLKFA